MHRTGLGWSKWEVWDRQRTFFIHGFWGAAGGSVVVWVVECSPEAGRGAFDALHAGLYLISASKWETWILKDDSVRRFAEGVKR